MRPAFEDILPLYEELGVQGAALRLRCRARTVSDILRANGVRVVRGRRPNSSLADRDRQVVALRAQKLSHAEIAATITRSVSLVRRILRRNRPGRD